MGALLHKVENRIEIEYKDKWTSWPRIDGNNMESYVSQDTQKRIMILLSYLQLLTAYCYEKLSPSSEIEYNETLTLQDFPKLHLTILYKDIQGLEIEKKVEIGFEPTIYNKEINGEGNCSLRVRNQVCFLYQMGEKDEVINMLSDRMKEELVRGLRDIFRNDISMIILYGSVARDEATTDSDVDIAIIVKRDMDEITKNKFINWSADMDIRYDRVFSIIDIQEEQMRKWGDTLPFYKNMQTEGIVLWKAT